MSVLPDGGLKSPYIGLLALLAFQAGFLNAFGFLACGRYISHVTGMGTQVGVALAEQRTWFAIELIGFPLFFVMGAFVSGLLTSARIERGKKPLYGWVTLIFPLMLLFLLSAGLRGHFGDFGESLSRSRDFLLLYSLSFFCGMQNGCFATMTKGQIRTTHLTGISTDIGTDLARIWFGELKGMELALSKRTNASRMLTFMAFAAGSVVSVKMSQDLGFTALVIPFLTSLGIWFVAQLIGQSLDLRFRREAGLWAEEAPRSNPLPPVSSHDNRGLLA